MTGFGRAQVAGPLGQFTVELKSVNSRFQEIRVHLPSSLSGLEPRLRELLKKEVRRGKIDCRVRFSLAPGNKPPIQFNEAAIQEYLRRLLAIGEKTGLKGEVSLSMLLGLPGVLDVEEEETDWEECWKTLSEALRQALERFQSERAREGAALAKQIGEEIEALRERRAKIAEGKDQVARKYREKLMMRIAELEEQTRGKLEPGRLELEVAMFADRCDVSEELVRLEAHLNRLETLTGNQNGKPVGKDLDFVIQEIMREVNTTAAKVRDLDRSQEVLEMKSAVERIREQIQNIE